MAATTFDLTWEDVLPELPFDPSSISAISTPSSGDLTAYLMDGGAQLAGCLAKSGVSADGIATLDDNTKRQCQDALKAYAAAKAMGRIGYAGTERDAKMARFDALLNLFATRPQMLARGTAAISTNVDTSSNKRPRTFGMDYKW